MYMYIQKALQLTYLAEFSSVARGAVAVGSQRICTIKKYTASIVLTVKIA